MRHVRRHDDIIEVDVDNVGAAAPDDVLSDVADEFQRDGPVRQLVIRLVGAPRGMGTLMRSLAAEARKRNVAVKWRL
jgi:hypothetical protein